MYYFNNALKMNKKIDEKYIIKNDLAKIDVLKTYEFMLNIYICQKYHINMKNYCKLEFFP